MTLRTIECAPDFAQNAACQKKAVRHPLAPFLAAAFVCLVGCGHGAGDLSAEATHDDPTAQYGAALTRSLPTVLSSSQTLTEVSTLSSSLCATVAMDGNTALFNDSYALRAVVVAFSGGRWQKQATLIPSLPGYVASYPYCPTIALSGDTAVLGYSQMYGPGSSAWTPQGAVFVFRRSGTTWTQEQALIGWGSSGLGIQIALSGDRLVAVTQAGNFLATYRRTAGTWTRLPFASLNLRSPPRQLSLVGNVLAIADGNSTTQVYQTDDVRWTLVDDLAGPVGYTSESVQLQADRLAVMWAGQGRASLPRHTFVQLYQVMAGRWVATQKIEHPYYKPLERDHLGWRLTFDRDWLLTHDSENGSSFAFRDIAGSWLPSWTIHSGRAHLAVQGSQVLRGQHRYGGYSSMVPEAFTLR